MTRLADLPELLTVDELQQVLRVKRSKAYEIARQLRVEVPGLGTRILRVRRSDLEHILNGEPCGRLFGR